MDFGIVLGWFCNDFKFVVDLIFNQNSTLGAKAGPQEIAVGASRIEGPGHQNPIKVHSNID